MTRKKVQSGVSRDITNRLINTYGKTWRHHYSPQLPPPTPLGAIWRVIMEQANLWPGPGGLASNKWVVYEDMYPTKWVDDTAPFLLLLGRYPPFFQADGTYASGVDPDVRRETARIKVRLYTQAGSPPTPRAGWAGVLFGTAELLCPPSTWTPALAHAFAQHNLLTVPTPRAVAQQFLASPDMAVLPWVNTEDATDCDDLCALTFFVLGVTFEQMERAHVNVPSNVLGSRRTAAEFERAAQRAIVKVLGSPAFFLWASGVDAASLPLDEQDAQLINHGIRPNWSVSDRNRALFAARKALRDFVAPTRPAGIPSPFDGYTWDSVDHAIRDPASHLAHAYKLWRACGTTTQRVLDLSARPDSPLTTAIPVNIRLANTKDPPYPLSREETKQKIVRHITATPSKTRYKLPRGLR